MQLEQHQCPVCGVYYGLDPAYYRTRQQDPHGNGYNWFCPNGHRLSVVTTKLAETEAELSRVRQLNAQLADEIATVRQAAVRERQARKAVEKENKRQIVRASAGVCSCCNRTFQQLARHMKAKHPELRAD